MKDAMNAVERGKSVRDAAVTFGIPKSTLHSKLKYTSPLNAKKGPRTVLTPNEETEIVNWLITCAETGFPVTKNQMLDYIQKFLKTCKRKNPFTNDRPGKEWYSSFMKRHTNLSERIAQNPTTSRALLNEQDIRLWFAKVQADLDSKNLTEIEPMRIFNLDESAFMLVPKDNTVLTKKGAKSVHQIVGKNEKMCITTLFIASASGVLPLPMVLFNLKYTPKKEILSRMPKESGVGYSDGGWMTADTFYNYVVNVFYKWLVKNHIPFPIILYANNHSSHVSIPLLKFCQEKKVELIGLYPNATSILQPLDVALFHTLKENYRRVLRQWKIDNDIVDFQKSMFPEVLHLALKDYDYSKGIKHGFE
ncbi:jerky protein homolog-like [Copidosoma floridanum]|uniref:jerky protein homolog-like n=1 Tax=Copidosoma floridanum TaxID=29053 RepID=UPI0006C9BFDF|nr:jerky protein homolog-like [Copidosoma floridanum]